MLHLILVCCLAALAHVALVSLARRAQLGSRPSRWVSIAWFTLLVVVAVLAIRRSPVLPTSLLEALGVLWIVPAVDLILLLAVSAVVYDRRKTGSILDRRRLFAAVLTGGAITATAAFAGRQEAVPRGDASALGGRGLQSGIDPIANGAAGDYTGRYGVPGQGTDSRTAIQAALDAASEVIGTEYYSYTSRRSTTVTLPPGQYLISAPADDASLVIPPGVVLDAAAATLYFDYPSTARASWCGIRVGQYGQLRAGKLYPAAGTAAPDGELVYDAVRLVQTDDNSHVIGYGDSEIRGWQGAAIRGVGAWLVFIKGLRITDNAYGYIASGTGDGILGYELSQPDPAHTRNHTDLRIQDCYFVNLNQAGIVGAVLGESGRLMAGDFESLSLTVGLVGCVFEQIRGPALDLTSAAVVTAWDCGFEEAGSEDGIILLDNCRVASFFGTRVNLTVPAGEPRPAARHIFRLSNTDSLVIDGMRVFTSSDAALQLADSAATVSWRVNNISPPDALSPGPMYSRDGSLVMSGQWDRGHLVLGSHHLWVDGSGALRHKDGPPGGDTDGIVVI